MRKSPEEELLLQKSSREFSKFPLVRDSPILKGLVTSPIWKQSNAQSDAHTPSSPLPFVHSGSGLHHLKSNYYFGEINCPLFIKINNGQLISPC